MTNYSSNWDSFVTGHPFASILQTTNWGRLKSDFGWTWETVTLDAGSNPKGGALVLYKSFPLRMGRVAYIPRGPVVDWSDLAVVRALLEKIQRRARQRGAWALWVEPELLDTPEATEELYLLGFSPSGLKAQPRHTVLIDLEESEDEIMARMKQKTRYNIGLAERKGVKIRRGNLDDIGAFHCILTQTALRNGFAVHEESYYRQALTLFARHSESSASLDSSAALFTNGVPPQASLWLAEVEGAIVAGVMIFAVGSGASYLYGGSSDQFRGTMPNYALQLAAIRWAKAVGCKTYDLWGIPDESEKMLETRFTERSDGLWGVYRFKRGFGGKAVRYVGSWEMQLNGLYGLIKRFQRVGGITGSLGKS